LAFEGLFLELGIYTLTPPWSNSNTDIACLLQVTQDLAFTEWCGAGCGLCSCGLFVHEAFVGLEVSIDGNGAVVGGAWENMSIAKLRPRYTVEVRYHYIRRKERE
jgi:hypothetical protein